MRFHGLLASATLALGLIVSACAVSTEPVQDDSVKAEPTAATAEKLVAPAASTTEDPAPNMQPINCHFTVDGCGLGGGGPGGSGGGGGGGGGGGLGAACHSCVADCTAMGWDWYACETHCRFACQ
jgi:uncharacterized membrane protein YgcG